MNNMSVSKSLLYSILRMALWLEMSPLAAPAMHVYAWHGSSMHAVGPCMHSTQYMQSLFTAYPLQKQVCLGERSGLFRGACTSDSKLS
jgi:hypothetical protein